MAKIFGKVMRMLKGDGKRTNASAGREGKKFRSKRSTFEAIRGVTGWVRPSGNHGCKPCTIVPVTFHAF
jgi:hypothetical protein